MKLSMQEVDKSSLIELPDFKTTDECEPLEGILGQNRAIQTLEFGLNIGGKGFNMYVAGPPGIGKMSSIESFVQKIARDREPPPDWCYLNNFKNPYEPVALKLPTGMGNEFKEDMERLVDLLENELSNAFISDEYSYKK